MVKKTQLDQKTIAPQLSQHKDVVDESRMPSLGSSFGRDFVFGEIKKARKRKNLEEIDLGNKYLIDKFTEDPVVYLRGLSEDDWVKRHYGLLALSERPGVLIRLIENSSQTENSPGTTITETLMHLASDRTREVGDRNHYIEGRKLAINLLVHIYGFIPSSEIFHSIFEIARTEPRREIKTRAIQALGEINQPDAPRLLAELASRFAVTNWQLYMDTISTLGGIKHEYIRESGYRYLQTVNLVLGHPENFNRDFVRLVRSSFGGYEWRNPQKFLTGLIDFVDRDWNDYTGSELYNYIDLTLLQGVFANLEREGAKDMIPVLRRIAQDEVLRIKLLNSNSHSKFNEINLKNWTKRLADDLENDTYQTMGY